MLCAFHKTRSGCRPTPCCLSPPAASLWQRLFGNSGFEFCWCETTHKAREDFSPHGSWGCTPPARGRQPHETRMGKTGGESKKRKSTAAPAEPVVMVPLKVEQESAEGDTTGALLACFADAPPPAEVHGKGQISLECSRTPAGSVQIPLVLLLPAAYRTFLLECPRRCPEGVQLSVRIHMWTRKSRADC